MSKRELATWLILWGVISTAVATGIVVGALVVLSSMPEPVSASRPAQQPERSFSPLPSVGRTEAPDSTTAPPSPSPTGTRPASLAKPRTAVDLRGAATWYCLPGRSACTRGFPADGYYAAAGPALRVGNWRGRTVVVEIPGAAVKVKLVDTCACPDGRLIDLYASAFAQLAPLSRGVLEVTVKW